MVLGRHSGSSLAASNISLKTFSASCHLPDVLHAPIKAEYVIVFACAAAAITQVTAVGSSPYQVALDGNKEVARGTALIVTRSSLITEHAQCAGLTFTPEVSRIVENTSSAFCLHPATSHSHSSFCGTVCGTKDRVCLASGRTTTLCASTAVATP